MQQSTPLISVIIPLYNAEKFIAKTLDSVINQTYSHIEILVVDDCSTDTSKEIVSKYNSMDKRITLIESKQNFGGPARPRNIGIENANGAYIAFLDADDLWVPTKLEQQLKFMLSNNLNISDTNYIDIDTLSNTIDLNNSLRKRFFNKRKKNLCRLIGSNFLALSSVIVKKDFIEMFSEENNFIAVEDYRLWLELFNKKDLKYAYLNETLLHYRVVFSSISERSTNGKQDTKAMLCSLDFIIKSNQFKLLPCFYKSMVIQWIKSFFVKLFKR